MHRSVVLRAVALLCLTAVFNGSGVIAEDHPILPELSSVRDILDLLGKLNEIGVKDKTVDLVVKEFQDCLTGSGVDFETIRKNLQTVLDQIPDMRGRLLTNPDGYGKYAEFTATDVFVKDAASELVYALPHIRNDLWILYFNTDDAGVKCLCYLSIIFNVKAFVSSREPAGTLPAALKDVIDFLGKLNDSPLKPKIIDRFDEMLRDHHTKNGFIGKGVKRNLTTLFENIPELRSALLTDTQDYGKCSIFEPSEQNLNHYVTALTHRLPILYNELWGRFFTVSNVDIRRICLKTLCLRGGPLLLFSEDDYLKGRKFEAQPWHRRHRYGQWKLFILATIFVLIELEVSYLYYKYTASQRCDLCLGCEQCCRCHRYGHCCCFCIRFWNRTSCEQCQTCTICKRVQRRSLILIGVQAVVMLLGSVAIGYLLTLAIEA